MNKPRFAVKVNQWTHLVVEEATGRCLGGFGSGFYRSWVFPLYTPAGLTVIQEFPHDHPFHNGFFVGQSPVVVDGRQGNFWFAPPATGANTSKLDHLGRVDAPQTPQTTIEAEKVRFRSDNVWRDEAERPMLDEIREVCFHADEEATICEMTSVKRASYGDIELPQTKFGSIGLRVEPRLLPATGGEIIADGGRRGDAGAVSGTDSDFVAYEHTGRNGRYGVLMTIIAPQARGPWFVRDYGMCMFDPTWARSIVVPQGESWTIGLRVAAYDGPLTAERIRRWTEK